MIGLHSPLGRRKTKVKKLGEGKGGKTSHPHPNSYTLDLQAICSQPLAWKGSVHVQAADAGPRELSAPSKQARPPGTDLPTAGLDHQLETEIIHWVE